MLLASIPIFSQKQANYWYFGRNAGLNFSMGAPVALTNGALNTGEGCSSISTSGGELEFYTDGRFVYNKEHDQMPHGSGLLGHSSSTQSGIIVPKPGSTTQYYIFTVDAKDNGLAAGLCYSRVDMTLDGGLGDVVTTEKNISLLPFACEKVTAVGHSNGSSIWVITHLWDSDAFYAFKVTTAGVEITPVISHTGPTVSGDMEASKGYIKVSPDGSKVAMANNTAFNVIISNFNNNSGAVSHIVTDYNYVNPGGQDPGGPYGVEFSPNSHFLYIGEWKANRRISQYNVTGVDPQTILDSKTIVATVGQSSDPIGALQLGPDNRMYIARQESSYLSRINSPNTQGTDCGFTDNAVNLAGKQSSYGLPPFIQSFFYLTADFYWDIPSCNGTPVQFFTSASDTPDSVRWNFGDPDSGPFNVSTLLNPTHLYPDVGNYWVTLTVYLYGVTKNSFHIVVVRPQPTVDIGNDTSICAYEPYLLDAGEGFETYLWQNGDTTQTSEAFSTGYYWCQVTGEGGCPDTDSIFLTVNPVPNVNAGPDKVIPGGVSTILEGSAVGGSGTHTVHWEPANKLVNANVIQPQTVTMFFNTQFILTVTDQQGGCVATDTVMVIISGGVLACNPAAEDNSICYGEQTTLHANPYGGSGSYTYSWTATPGTFTSSTANPVVSPGETTTYHLTVTDDFSSVNGNVTVTVNPRPLPHAGNDTSILFATTAFLQGSASLGSGNYTYHWEPTNMVTNPSGAQTTTVPLLISTPFYLTVTDAQTGCTCLDNDDIIVTVTGTELSINPQADPDTICAGDSTQLYSLATGGANSYDYLWHSVPSSGFPTTLANPVVYPTVTTEYFVTITDGYSQVSGSVRVVVFPSHEINFTNDTVVCVFDTLILDAGYAGPGTNYVWSNGSDQRVVKVATTGIGYDVQDMWVKVTTPNGCEAQDDCHIVFDFAVCFGIDDPESAGNYRLYPNPGNGIIHIESASGKGNALISVFDIFGKKVIDDREFLFTESQKSFILDLGDSPAGLYMIRMTAGGKEVVAMKYLLR